MSATAKRSGKRRPSFLVPDYLYALAGFRETSGVSASRMHEARRRGIEPVCIQVGRRIFIRGSDAIAYIEELAELTSDEELAELETTPQ